MTDEHREFLRANMYFVAGFIPGLVVGTAICATSFGRAFLDPTQFPTEARGVSTIMLCMISPTIIHYLQRGWLAPKGSKLPNQQTDISQSNT